MTHAQRIEQNWFSSDGLAVVPPLTFRQLPTAELEETGPFIGPRTEREVAEAAYNQKTKTAIQKLRKSTLVVLCVLKFKGAQDHYASMNKKQMEGMIEDLVHFLPYILLKRTHRRLYSVPRKPNRGWMMRPKKSPKVPTF